MPDGLSLLFRLVAIDSSPRHRFSADEEQQFERETGPARSRALIWRGLMGIAIYLSYLPIDWILTPDVFTLAVIIRAAIIMPLALLSLYIVWRNPSPFLREGSMALVCVLGGAGTLWIMLASQDPLRDQHHHIVILVALFLVVVLRLRLPYAVTACLSLFALETGSLWLIPQPEPVRTLLDLVTFAGACALCLIAAATFERNMRAAYLFGRAQYQRSETLHDLTRLDPLTGLGNRRALDEALAQLAADPDEAPYAFIVADIDHFKSYNDALGHLAGDVCLKRVAGLLTAELRGDRDRAIRYGGEEFVILLPATDLRTAVLIADRMRRNIADALIPHPGRSGGIVTVSLGVAAAPKSITAEQTIAAADAALYAAKNAGRNQVWPRPVRAIDEVRRAESA